MKKIMFIICSIAILFLVNPIYAEEYHLEYEKLEDGIGLNKLNPDDLTHTIRQDQMTVYLKGYYTIPANTTYALYASYDFTGDVSTTGDIVYGLWDTQTKEFLVKTEIGWNLGGWYAYAHIVNNTDKDCYMYIYDFGVWEGYSSQTAYQNVIMQEIANPFENEEIIHEYKGYVNFYSESSGYDLCKEERTLTVVEGTNLNDDDLKELVVCEGFYGSLEPISVETNYESTPGNYVCTYNYDNGQRYTLNIQVIEDIVPTIEGPSVVTINLTDWNYYTKYDLFENYIGIYGTQSYRMMLSEESEVLFEKAYGYPGTTELTLECTFAGGKVAHKTITLQVINDGYYEFYVKNYILKTSVTEEMTEDQIKDYIDANLNFDLGQKVDSLEIISNAYNGNEHKSGKYEVLFKYRVNKHEYLSSLTIEVNEPVEINTNWINIIIPSVSIIMVLSMGVILIIQRRKVRRS